MISTHTGKSRLLIELERHDEPSREVYPMLQRKVLFYLIYKMNFICNIGSV